MHELDRRQPLFGQIFLFNKTHLPSGEGSKWWDDFTIGYFDSSKALKNKQLKFRYVLRQSWNAIYAKCNWIIAFLNPYLLWKIIFELNQLCKTFFGFNILQDKTTHLYPQVLSLVEGPKSEYISSLSENHILRSLFPRYGLEQSLSRRPITSAPRNIQHIRPSIYNIRE